MSDIKKVLCVCLGNSDRSPLMAAVLGMYLQNAGHEVTVESAGMMEFAKNGGSASPNGVVSAKRLGLDLSTHQKRWVGSLDLTRYDLIICVDEVVAGELFGKYKVPTEKIFNIQLNNPWPSSDQRDHDEVAENVMAKMYRVVTRRFSEE
jgi:protein-tyrosine-phosphatase